jgi:hypothetical protein
MSGFRSRFPTVTPWTTDQDLSDIVFRPCFTSVVNEFAPACLVGTGRRHVARPGRCLPARREPTAGRGGSAPGPVTRKHASRCHRSQRLMGGRAGPSPARPVNRPTSDHPPVTAIRRSHPLAFGGPAATVHRRGRGAGPRYPSLVTFTPPVAPGLRGLAAPHGQARSVSSAVAGHGERRTETAARWDG